MAFRGIHDADPSDTSVLLLQDRHRSHLVDTEQVRKIWMFHCLQLQEILRPRQQMRAFMSMWRMDIRIQPYVIRSGFYGIYRLGHIAIDWPLITALVERWRPETHMFHVPVREMTITLQDVTILLGLRIHGPAVTGTCVFDVVALCAKLLGVIPLVDAIRGASARFSLNYGSRKGKRFIVFFLTQYNNFIIFTHFLIILYSAMVMGETTRRATRFWASTR